MSDTDIHSKVWINDNLQFVDCRSGLIINWEKCVRPETEQQKSLITIQLEHRSNLIRIILKSMELIIAIQLISIHIFFLHKINAIMNKTMLTAKLFTSAKNGSFASYISEYDRLMNKLEQMIHSLVGQRMMRTKLWINDWLTAWYEIIPCSIWWIIQIKQHQIHFKIIFREIK